MKNRKSVMFVSALLILVFHLWVNITDFEFEKYLRAVSYIGVDMFFFLSAYSMGKRDVLNYKSFVKSRFVAVYLKFVIFALVAFLYSNWKVKRLLRVVTGFELLTKGGGAFLWFLPTIMLFYLLIPFLQKADRKNRKLTIISLFATWALIGVLVTSLTKYNSMFIFFNRIPVFILGFYVSRIMNEKNIELTNKQKTVAGLLLLVIGTICLYKFGYKVRLNKPIYDLFYIFAIPSSVGLILLSDLIPENLFIKTFGSVTLEIYAIQMIFGFNIANTVIRVIGRSKMLHSLLINIVVISLVLVISEITNRILNYLFTRFNLR